MAGYWILYRFGVEYEENLHAGDIVEHPVDVITHRGNQHHRSIRSHANGFVNLQGLANSFESFRSSINLEMNELPRRRN